MSSSPTVVTFILKGEVPCSRRALVTRHGCVGPHLTNLSRLAREERAQDASAEFLDAVRLLRLWRPAERLLTPVPEGHLGIAQILVVEVHSEDIELRHHRARDRVDLACRQLTDCVARIAH